MQHTTSIGFVDPAVEARAEVIALTNGDLFISLELGKVSIIPCGVNAEAEAQARHIADALIRGADELKARLAATAVQPVEDEPRETLAEA